MYNKKWKKLSKRFACALALAMLMSVNPAWAEVKPDGDRLEITNETVTNSEHNGKFDLSSKYLNVNIINENKRGIDISGAGDFNTLNTSFTVTVKGETENCDALHIRGSNNNVYVKDFAAYVHAHNSDAINMSHDVDKGNASVIVNENLTAVVDYGNGIRANGSRNGNFTSTLTVNGTTDITLKAGSVEQSYSITPDMANRLDKDYLDGKLSQFVEDYKDNLVESLDPLLGLFVSSIWESMEGTPIDKVFNIADMEAVGLYHTAAVYAGNSASPLINEWGNDGDTKGRGIINLRTTDITLNGNGSYGVYAGKNGTINIDGNLTIKSDGIGGYGVAARGLNLIYGETNVTATATIKDELAIYLPNGYDKEVPMTLDGLNLDNAPNTFGSYVTLNGDENTITMGAGGKALYASGRSENNEHGNSNTISSGDGGIGYLKATGDVAADDGGKISLELKEYLTVNGSVSAESEGTVAFVSKSNNTIESSVQRVTKAGEQEVKFTNAVYADGKNSNVEITVGDGGVNTIATYTPEAAADSKERTVWAANGGTVKITGAASVTAGLTELAEASGSGANIAIAAGMDDWQTNAHKDSETGEIIFDVADDSRSRVYLNYGDAAGTASSVTGDIVSGYGGSVRVAKAAGASNSSNIKFSGDALAANGGELSLALGDGGVWHGRADDYKDAESEEWRKAHTDIFAPQFSNGIQSNGFVNVNLGSGSVWNVTGQSWVSKLEGDGHIYLNGEKTGGYAVHIGELTGSNTFYLNLHNGAEIANGDMIYVANSANKAQNIVIVNRDEVLSSMKAGDRIRFATLGNADIPFSESTATPAAFGRSTRIKDAGMLNVDFSIDYLDYNHADNDDENHDAYHGGSEMSAKKPGAEYVDSIYRANENSQNVYITRLESTENPTEEPKLSDAGRTVLNMSRANYAAAVYMDRLNKRMGEARYFAGQDEGIWARIRHDRVGRDDAFLVQNTMFEVGYDRKIASKTGTRRVGIAADYMEGDTEYNNIAGEGEIDRFGLWLYSTWLGEKGHYTDYVLKWGRMSNEFDIYGMSTGERITGDYDNNVFSASAEYGRKIELGKGWFFEPQAQVQFARITDADYVTSQGTRVEVDGVNSLIARAGFRLGREFGGKNQGSVYVKADVLHEFLGDQDVHALDGTTDSRWYTVGYDNDGTWYDVGLGLSCRTGKNSFVFLDLEHSFGNDNDDSYQISAGVQWSF